jgi:hypothetical protein
MRPRSRARADAGTVPALPRRLVARVEERPALLRIALWEMAGATPEQEVPLTAHVRPIVECLAEGVREGQRQGVFRADIDPVGS